MNRFEHLLIVAEDAPDLCDYLTRQFSGVERVQVLLDRRRGQRRWRDRAHEPERRGGDRRQPSSRPRSNWFVVARQTD